MNNPMQLINLLKGNKSPKELCFELLGINNNPVIKNLVGMAEKGDKKGVEEFARNMFKEQGRDFDKEFSEFSKNFK